MSGPDDDQTTYRDAGVDLEAAERAVDGFRESVQSTRIPGVLDAIGGFGGLFQLDAGPLSRDDLQDPVLAASSDGVGTKLRIAFRTGRHDTIGIDCVAMCVNDILTTGARPLFFLDYLATGELDPGQAEVVVEGMAEGCRRAGCALLGGETAEMPGFYAEGEYDVAGFAVGCTDASSMVDGTSASPGDAVVGLASTGIHSNGFSLVRKVLNDADIPLDDPVDELQDDRPLGELLLEPTRIYVDPVLDARDEFDLHALAHVTGGGLPGNLARPLPDSLEVEVDRNAWEPPEIFAYLQQLGEIPVEECFRVFNMGVGFGVVVDDAVVEDVCSFFEARHVPARRIGEVIPAEPSDR